MRTTRARRALTTTAAVAALGLTLAACGGDDDETVAPEEPSSSEAATSEDQAAPESGSEGGASENDSDGADSDEDSEVGVPGEGSASDDTPTDGGSEEGPIIDETEGDALTEGDPITELSPDADVNLARMVPDGDTSFAEVVSLDGDTVTYMYGDVGQSDPEVQETIELEPGAGDDVRAELVDLGLTVSEGTDGPPDSVTEELIYWEIGDPTSTGGSNAASTGDAELDAAVYEILIGLVPEDLRAG
ncbi:MAG: hypothetical protein ACTHW7_11525 [Actinomycetaceae bacterium]